MPGCFQLGSFQTGRCQEMEEKRRYRAAVRIQERPSSAPHCVPSALESASLSVSLSVCLCLGLSVLSLCPSFSSTVVSRANPVCPSVFFLYLPIFALPVLETGKAYIRGTLCRFSFRLVRSACCLVACVLAFYLSRKELKEKRANEEARAAQRG